MNSRFPDREQAPLIRTFDEIPVLPRLIKPHHQIIGAAQAYGLKDMPDTVEAYLRLSQRARNDVGQRVEMSPGNPVTLPVTEIEIDARNVRSVGQEVAAGTLISWTLYNNRVVRVPWTKTKLDDSGVDFGVTHEEDAVRFQRLLPQEAYLAFVNIYSAQLKQIQDVLINDFGRLFHF